MSNTKDIHALATLNISDHIRQGERQHVTAWHLNTLVDTGFAMEELHTVPTARQRHGANGHLRVEGETVAVLTKAIGK